MHVLLLSGGLDSAVCLAIELPQIAIFVDYGQPHMEMECRAARKLALHYDILLTVVRADLPGHHDPNDGSMLWPGRNLALLSLAAMIGRPVIGCNRDDYDGYPDCRPEFFDALRPIIDVDTPLLYMGKPEIGALAGALGVPIDLTWSCYYPDGSDPCGKCDACKARKRAVS